MLLTRMLNKLIKKIFFIALCTLSFNSTYALLPMRMGLENQASALDEDKVLQARVLQQIDALLLFIPSAGSRLQTLKLSKEKVTEIREMLTDLQKSLQLHKARATFNADKEKLAKLSLLLNGLTKAIHVSLTKSFSKMPDVNPADINRSIKEITPEQMNQLMEETEKNLNDFQHLVNNMGKNIFNRWYTKASDWWNKPLFTISSFSQKNAQVYPWSIVKRAFSYSGTIALTVHNLPEAQLQSISNSYVRSWALAIKGLVGDSPIATQISKHEKYHEVKVDEDYGWTIGGTTLPHNTSQEKIIYEDGLNPIDQQGLPLAYYMTTPEGRTWNEKSYISLTIENGKITPKKALEDGKRYFVDAGNGMTIPFNNTDAEIILGSLQFKGRTLFEPFPVPKESLVRSFFGETTNKKTYRELLEILNNKTIAQDFEKFTRATMITDTSNGRVLQEFEPGRFRFLGTNIPAIPSSDTLNNPNRILPTFNAWNKDFQWEGKTIDPLLVNQTNKGELAQSVDSSEPFDKSPRTGVLNFIRNNLSFLAHIDFKANFLNVAVGPFVAKQIYDDIKILKEELPLVAANVHRKLRGEQGTFVKANEQETPKETFDDIVGREDIKKQLQPIIDFVSNPERSIQEGIAIPRGYLFAGEPQTGKSLMAKAVAGEIAKALTAQGKKECKFWALDVGFLMTNGIGYCVEYIKAYNLAPCVLFLDEFDLTGAQRNENKKFLADALTAINGYTTSSDLSELIIFIIATNRPEHIDYAIRADGRCGTMIYFENPYYDARKNFFKSFFEKRFFDLNNFDLDVLAQETEACSYSTLTKIIEQTASIAKNKAEIPSQKHANEALDIVVRKVIADADEIPQEKRQVIAARYGAKALASVTLSPEKKFTGVSIMKMTEKIKEKHVLQHYEAVADADEKTGVRFGGIFSYHSIDTYHLISNAERIKECKIAIAGTVGQKVLGLDYIAYGEDETEALTIARRIIFNGCDEKLLPRKIREQKLEQAYLLVEHCRKEMEELIESRKQEFAHFVDLLQRRQVLRASDVKQCFKLNNFDLISDYFATQKPGHPDAQPSSVSFTQASSELSGPSNLPEYTTEDEELDAIEEEEEEENQSIAGHTISRVANVSQDIAREEEKNKQEENRQSQDQLNDE